MADPTLKNRQAIKEGVRAVIPSSTPLGQSLDAAKKAEDEQLAVDEANNLVMQRGPVQLPAEAQNFANPGSASSSRTPADQSAGGEFINPSESQGAQAPASAVPAMAQSSQVATPSLPDQSGEYDKLLGAAETKANAEQVKIDELQQKKLDAFKQIDERDKVVEKVKPTELFAGKSTWQKILGGVGMFAGSLTPEGARNVANMIDKEIERDQNLQITNIKLKRDKEDRHFQNLVQQFGSQEAALVAKKRDVYTALGLHVKKLELASKNAETRARFAQGAQEIELKKQALGQQLMTTMLKQQKEAQKDGLAGYNGPPLDPTTKREFVNMLSSGDTIRGSLASLSEIVKGSGDAIPFTQKNDRAKQYVNDIQLQLKEIKKLGVLSGSDSVRLENYISDPSFFKSDDRMQADIRGVQDLVNKAISAQEKRLGLTKIMPQGARKI